MKNLQKFKDFLTEGLPIKEINPLKFPNPQKQNTEFFTKGKRDGDAYDDVVYTKEIGIPAKSLKASQDAVYLGKALGMAVGGVEGGDLDAVISKDNRILDGHHRWAATIFNNPSAKINGVKADLNIGDLVPVLRAAGDAMGNKRGLPPEGGDISIFVATIDDVKKAIFDGEWMDKKYYNREKAIKWFNKVGEDNIEKALNLIKRNGPPQGAPPRADMPKIKPDQVDKVSNDLSAGKIDVREPYNESLGYINKSTMKNLQSFDEFLNEAVKADTDLGALILKFLWVRDQAHVFHWQTKLNARHVTLGDFYESYLEELDELAENIFGKIGETFQIGKGQIELVDISETAIEEYKQKVTEIFEIDFPKLFPKTYENEVLYHIIGDILEEINKMKYLLSQK